MRYLKLRTDVKPRACGAEAITPLIVDASRRYAKNKKERLINKLKCQLIVGAHDSGKSRWLDRLYENWKGIWGAKCKSPPIFLGALQPISTWCDQVCLENWYTARLEKLDAPNLKPWPKINQQQRCDLIADYLLETKSVLFVDDAHKLTGRKLQLVRQAMLSSRIWVIAASAENRLPPSMRPVVERRNPQRTQLSTDASYDATGAVMWGAVALALAIGWWEVSLVIGGLRMLGRGRTAARPD